MSFTSQRSQDWSHPVGSRAAFRQPLPARRSRATISCNLQMLFGTSACYWQRADCLSESSAPVVFISSTESARTSRHFRHIESSGAAVILGRLDYCNSLLASLPWLSAAHCIECRMLQLAGLVSVATWLRLSRINAVVTCEIEHWNNFKIIWK